MTVKPLELCKYLINLSVYSKDAVVLDPFVGSGTVALASKELGKNYIGIDINPEYVKIAEKRLNTSQYSADGETDGLYITTRKKLSSLQAKLI